MNSDSRVMAPARRGGRLRGGGLGEGGGGAAAGYPAGLNQHVSPVPGWFVTHQGVQGLPGDRVVPGSGGGIDPGRPGLSGGSGL